MQYYGYKAQIKLALYYESRGPDSSLFITEQLYPLILKFGGVPNKFIEVEFMPYGKAMVRKVKGKTEIECNHGPDECHENKVHGCALKILASKDAAAFIHCSVKSLNNNTSCLKKVREKGNKIRECVKSPKVDSIMTAFGRKTENLVPKMYYRGLLLMGNGAKSSWKMQRIKIEQLICLKIKNQGAKAVACAQYY
ncbi:Gamma-interferon-inducible lysosomal thiol reductase [Orchesella cincta]|uniref:Gamma-interferon-inducible lysosomal thiol reductase n=1 Tax=Orchesella cincta TaxID=48709 RepID=A0A1D2M5L2_ORCCI|nr:Gamma-interferon-inducible lysosomal thiol reductase [Orchesella cincta]